MLEARVRATASGAGDKRIRRAVVVAVGIKLQRDRIALRGHEYAQSATGCAHRRFKPIFIQRQERQTGLGVINDRAKIGCGGRRIICRSGRRRFIKPIDVFQSEIIREAAKWPRGRIEHLDKQRLSRACRRLHGDRRATGRSTLREHFARIGNAVAVGIVPNSQGDISAGDGARRSGDIEPAVGRGSNELEPVIIARPRVGQSGQTQIVKLVIDHLT